MAEEENAHLAGGGGLLGAIGIVFLAVTIRIRHPDGTKTSVTVPDGSNVTVNEKGDVDVDGSQLAPLALLPERGKG